jgi:hypothetical protein
MPIGRPNLGALRPTLNSKPAVIYLKRAIKWSTPRFEVKLHHVVQAEHVGRGVLRGQILDGLPVHDDDEILVFIVVAPAPDQRVEQEPSELDLDALVRVLARRGLAVDTSSRGLLDELRRTLAKAQRNGEGPAHLSQAGDDGEELLGHAALAQQVVVRLAAELDQRGGVAALAAFDDPVQSAGQRPCGASDVDPEAVASVRRDLG